MTIPEALKIAQELHRAGRLSEAEWTYRQVLKVQSTVPPAHFNLGILLFEQDRLDEACASFEEAVRQQPAWSAAHVALGNVLKTQDRHNDASAAFQRALECDPANADAYINLGSTWQILGQLEKAMGCFQKALELSPNSVEAHNNLATAWKELGHLQDAIASFRQALKLKPDQADVHSNLLYTLLFSPDYDAKMLAEEHHLWTLQHAQTSAAPIQPHSNERSPNRRLRVGYVSPDLYDHVVGRNVLPLFQNHDHQQFEIYGYANLSWPDALTRQFQSHADVWRNVNRLKDDQLARQIRDDRIDILVDLALHTAGNRLLTFARKPAPVQITFAGYPGTTGLSTIDYRLTDPYLDPPELFQAYCSERPLRLADSFWCYDPLTSEPAVNPLPALTNGFVTFGCLSNFCKVNRSVLELWASVLKEVKNARLLLSAPEGICRRETLEVLANRQIAPERVNFVSALPRLEYLALYHQIDIGLDTLPYNGHTTTLDSLWMGIPVVTLVGRTMVGRAGVSQLTNVGLTELVAETPERFTEIATGLAEDLPRLCGLRADLRKKMQESALMDSKRFTRNIENAYREAWQRWCEQQV